jgi:hypothetical protein
MLLDVEYVCLDIRHTPAKEINVLSSAVNTSHSTAPLAEEARQVSDTGSHIQNVSSGRR